MTTKTAAPATDKQRAFAHSLIDEISRYSDEFDAAGAQDLIETADKRQASMIIDHLIGSRDLYRREARQAAAPAARDIPEGIHYHDGTVYKVQRSQHGRLYAKQLNTSSEQFEYVGQKPFRHLSDDTLMTLDDAEQFGQLYGICARCGLLLTDEKSIARGVGPVCAKKF